MRKCHTCLLPSKAPVLPLSGSAFEGPEGQVCKEGRTGQREPAEGADQEREAALRGVEVQRWSSMQRPLGLELPTGSELLAETLGTNRSCSCSILLCSSSVF